jgi:hypothetical protein
MYATQKHTFQTFLHNAIVTSSVLCLFHVRAACSDQYFHPPANCHKDRHSHQDSQAYIHAKTDQNPESGCDTAHE